MTPEEKQLLLKDLCARLSYGVVVRSTYYTIDIILDDNWTVKPYLRPMSSMTEEEKKELNNVLEFQYYSDDSCMCESTDWLNAHHFDYRGLIEKGLALEAPEGMYKTE